MAPERRSAAGNGAAVMKGTSIREVRKDFSDVLETGATRLLAAVGEVVVAASGERDGSKAYLVGGFVRDGLLGRRTADVDIAVADGLVSAGRLADRIGGKKARVALARKMAVILHRMLADGAAYRETAEAA